MSATPHLSPENPAMAEVRPATQAMQEALGQRRFFKLIGGGSLTEAERIAQLATAYIHAGVDCIDIAPDAALLDTVSQVLTGNAGSTPVVMVSIPLDPDPHFRKIELDDPACIRCGLCLPACPTEALTLPSDALAISQALCYGCGRCVPTCPTDALHLLPFQVESQIEAAVSHPLTGAVEIHSRYVDPYMLEAFLIRWKTQLQGKLIALCFRPQELPAQQIIAFYQTAQARSALPIILQIDGAPMSGNDDPEASRPALEAACLTRKLFIEAGLPVPIITISGGINEHTAALLQAPNYQWIAGVGMGTVARKALWNASGNESIQIAQRITKAFQQRGT